MSHPPRIPLVPHRACSNGGGRSAYVRGPASGGGPAPRVGGVTDDNVRLPDDLHDVAAYPHGDVPKLDLTDRQILTVRGGSRPLWDVAVRVDTPTGPFLARTNAAGSVLISRAALGLARPTLVSVDGHGSSWVDAGATRLDVEPSGGRNPRPVRLDVAYVVDTTSSMDDEVARLCTTLTSVVAGRTAAARRLNGIHGLPGSRWARTRVAWLVGLAAGLASPNAPSVRADDPTHAPPKPGPPEPTPPKSNRPQTAARLIEHFARLASTFGQGDPEVGTILTGPTPVRRPNDQSPGRRWQVALGTATFKITTQDATKLGAGDVLAHLRRIPPVYRRILEIVSEGEKAGVAVDTELGGAAAHGSQDDLNLIPQANAFVLVHEAGHILEQRTTRSQPETLDRWKVAIATDKVSVSEYGDTVAHEDLAEFALVYALCLDAGPARLEELRQRSPTRFARWEAILERSGAVPRAKAPSDEGRCARAGAPAGEGPRRARAGRCYGARWNRRRTSAKRSSSSRVLYRATDGRTVPVSPYRCIVGWAQWWPARTAMPSPSR